MQLSGAQEVPTNASTGTGSVTVTLNRTTGAVSVTGNFSGLSSNATAAHIHGPAAIGSNAAVLIPLTIPQSTSGSVTGSGTMTQIQMNDMIGGMTYVNVHSEDFPDGELRAQIVP
jgi:bifunctional N-acetylglucosamine-1-phosphate-uridyltransferase/glucosamine-1-phosphate-acetyltransferase GlmU-like protein